MRDDDVNWPHLRPGVKKPSFAQLVEWLADADKSCRCDGGNTMGCAACVAERHIKELGGEEAARALLGEKSNPKPRKAYPGVMPDSGYKSVNEIRVAENMSPLTEDVIRYAPIPTVNYGDEMRARVAHVHDVRMQLFQAVEDARWINRAKRFLVRAWKWATQRVY